MKALCYLAVFLAGVATPIFFFYVKHRHEDWVWKKANEARKQRRGMSK